MNEHCFLLASRIRGPLRSEIWYQYGCYVPLVLPPSTGGTLTIRFRLKNPVENALLQKPMKSASIASESEDDSTLKPKIVPAAEVHIPIVGTDANTESTCQPIVDTATGLKPEVHIGRAHGKDCRSLGHCRCRWSATRLRRRFGLMEFFRQICGNALNLFHLPLSESCLPCRGTCDG